MDVKKKTLISCSFLFFSVSSYYIAVILFYFYDIVKLNIILIIFIDTKFNMSRFTLIEHLLLYIFSVCIK